MTIKADLKSWLENTKAGRFVTIDGRPVFIGGPGAGGGGGAGSGVIRDSVTATEARSFLDSAGYVDQAGLHRKYGAGGRRVTIEIPDNFGSDKTDPTSMATLVSKSEVGMGRWRIDDVVDFTNTALGDVMGAADVFLDTGDGVMDLL